MCRGGSRTDQQQHKEGGPAYFSLVKNCMAPWEAVVSPLMDPVDCYSNTERKEC